MPASAGGAGWIHLDTEVVVLSAANGDIHTQGVFHFEGVLDGLVATQGEPAEVAA